VYEFVRRNPHPGLDGLVRTYTGFRERTAGPLRRREMPSSEVVLILDLGPGWRLLDPDDPADPGERYGSFTAGLGDRPAVVEHGGEAHCVQVNLTPLGARALLGVPTHELAGRVVAFEDLAGAQGGLLVEQLESAPDWEQRFALLDGLFVRRAERAAVPRPDVEWAWRRLEQTDGLLPVSELARELGCSRRHLTARFREEIGLAPKRFARLLRFRRAIAMLEDSGESTLAEVAARCGYYDQAHFNRDFLTFAGITPTQLLASMGPGPVQSSG
jgi:AraC-like DNA-binding protein